MITPYIDTLYFDQPLGNPELGEREIDAQTWSSTVYQGTTMGHQKTVFGVNFIDGRIKGYPLLKKGEENRMYFRMVRGNHEADVPGDNDKIWMETFDFALNYSYDYRNVTFVGLDNYIDGEHTVDMDWLEQNLKEHEPDRLLVPFGHEPAFTSDTYHPWCLDANPENRNAFWQLLSAYNMPYYFCGHAHQYNKSVITYKGDSRIQIVCGGGGGNLQPQRGGSPDEYGYEVNLLEFRSEYGYLCVTVSGNTLNPQWRRVLPNENNISKNVRKIRPAGNKRRNQLKNIR